MLPFLSFNSLNLRSTWFPTEPEKWPPDARVVTHFGQRVLWCPRYPRHPTGGVSRPDEGGRRHFTSDELEPYRRVGDVEMDYLLCLLHAEGRRIGPGDDLFHYAQRAAAAAASTSTHDKATLPHPVAATVQSVADRALASFYNKYSRVPSWVDPQQLRRGQQVYLAYSWAISISQYYRSLVPGFSIPKIAAVLKSTRYLSPPSDREQVLSRLSDTGALFASCVCDDVSGMLPPAGEGWKAALRVRVLHAKVRRVLLSPSRKWNIDGLGVPINQEDMAATLLALFGNSLMGCEMILGFPLPMQERLDFQAFWRYLGWLLGIQVMEDNDDEKDNDGGDKYGCGVGSRGRLRPLDPCGPGWDLDKQSPSKPSLDHSRAVFESIILHLLHPDHTSVEIAHHLLKMGRFQHDQNGESSSAAEADLVKARQTYENRFYYRCLQCRRFVGDPLADALRLPYHPKRFQRVRLWVLSTIYLLAVRLYTMAALPWSPLRDYIVRFHLHLFRRYMRRWRDSHPQRVRKALAQSGDGGFQRRPKEVFEGRTEFCPFAMIKEPQSIKD